MLYLGIFGLKFNNNIVTLEITTFEFVSLKILWKKQKFLNLGTKNALFGYF